MSCRMIRCSSRAHAASPRVTGGALKRQPLLDATRSGLNGLQSRRRIPTGRRMTQGRPVPTPRLIRPRSVTRSRQRRSAGRGGRRSRVGTTFSSAPAATRLPTTGMTAGTFETRANWPLTVDVSPMTRSAATDFSRGMCRPRLSTRSPARSTIRRRSVSIAAGSRTRSAGASTSRNSSFARRNRSFHVRARWFGSGPTDTITS